MRHTAEKTPGARFANDEKGAAFLEATIVIPVLLAIGLGVFEFANFMYQQHLMQFGVRDAARYVARLPWPVSATHQTNAQNLAVTGQLSGGTSRVSGWAVSDVNVAFRPVANSGFTINGNPAYLYPGSVATNINMVVVTSTVTYQDLGFLGNYFKLGPITMTVAHEERHIGNT